MTAAVAKAHRFHPSVLRAYDIRGVVGETLTEADAEALGRAFGTVLRRRLGSASVSVGYDGRLSSPRLKEALVQGLADTGARVLSVGRGPTPMLYYAVHELKTEGGVMVTGSHNPPGFNGFKLVLGAKPFYGDDIQELARIAAAGAYEAGEGAVEERPVMAGYVDRLVEAFGGQRPLTVAWDAGNGAAGEVMAAVSARLPGRHILLNERVDGTFPAHHPDPTVAKHLEQLIATVRRERCDLGVAFDGDGDRIGVVDEEGRILWGDQLLAIFAADVLRRRPGATIVFDVKASQILFDEVARLGGRPLMWRTGHSPIKAKMAEEGSPLGGEVSGHIFFADRYYGFDDALYAAVR
ncbi:MAG: phosphomannomutase/phosphoglucomutase, partial [Alphaproteobacteria bacterium]